MNHNISLKKRIFNIILEFIIALFIILWIYTGTNKLLNHEETAIQMGRSPFIAQMAIFLSFAVPISELLLVALLVFKRTRLIGLYGSLFLITIFTGYIYIMLYLSYDLPCSCGGVLKQLSWEDHLIFNIGFSILSIIGIVIQTFLYSYPPGNFSERTVNSF